MKIRKPPLYDTLILIDENFGADYTISYIKKIYNPKYSTIMSSNCHIENILDFESIYFDDSCDKLIYMNEKMRDEIPRNYRLPFILKALDRYSVKYSLVNKKDELEENPT